MTTDDNLIEELERLRCDRHEDDTHCLRADCDDRFNLASAMVHNFPAILSALKENKRLREGEQQAKSALYSVIAHWDEFGPEYGFSEAVDLARAALQPQGEK